MSITWTHLLIIKKLIMKKIKMVRFRNYFLGLLLMSVAFLPACKLFNCCIEPDLISELAAPTTNIIKGEPVDWDYVIESVEENSQKCDILKAAASIGKIVVDFFADQNDKQGDTIFSNENNVGALMPGQTQSVTNTIDVFDEKGIYLITVKADETDLVDERREDNNFDTLEAESRALEQVDLFQNASEGFKEKLDKAAAIVIVGRVLNDKDKIHAYKGKPIYYAK